MNNKKKGLFAGWRDVFSFTFHDTTKSKAFRMTTIITAVLCFVLIAGAMAAVAFSQGEKDEKEPTKLENVYVVNETEYAYLDFSAYKDTTTERYKKVTFKKAANFDEQVKGLKAKEALVKLTKKDSSINVKMYVSNESECSDDSDDFLETVTKYIQQSNLMNSGLSTEQLGVVLSPVATQFTHEGNAPESLAVTLVRILVPLILVMFLYFMIVIYGQSVAKSVAAEKTSKLVETLLLSVQPYALIAGKILAMSLVGILQILIWAAGVALGVFGGHYIGLVVNSDFKNPLIEVMDSLSKMNIGSALSTPAVILGVLALIVGFVLYCVLAGMVASRVQKNEDLSASMGTYQFVVVIGFMLSYFTLLQGNTMILNIIRWIPITSAFLLPCDVIVGNVSLGMGIGQLCVLIVCLVLLIILTGRIYRNQLFYRGKK